MCTCDHTHPRSKDRRTNGETAPKHLVDPEHVLARQPRDAREHHRVEALVRAAVGEDDERARRIRHRRLEHRREEPVERRREVRPRASRRTTTSEQQRPTTRATHARGRAVDAEARGGARGGLGSARVAGRRRRRTRAGGDGAGRATGGREGRRLSQGRRAAGDGAAPWTCSYGCGALDQRSVWSSVASRSSYLRAAGAPPPPPTNRRPCFSAHPQTGARFPPPARRLTCAVLGRVAGDETGGEVHWQPEEPTKNEWGEDATTDCEGVP